jgi:hypothetical protein
MKKVFLFSILICLFLIQGCVGSGQWIAMKRNPLIPCEGKNTTQSISYDKNYTIGENKSAFIGQEIISLKKNTRIIKSYEFINSFVAPKDFIVTLKYLIDTFQLKIEANKKYQIEEMIVVNDIPYFLIKLPRETKSNHKDWWGILVSCYGSVYKSCIYSYDFEMLFYPSFITFTPDVQNTEFIAQNAIKEIKDLNVSPGMMYELIYSGKNDVSLNMIYREYSANDFARPAFFQNLTYQVNAKQIRFKDFVIQIHSATNEKIAYTVLEDGLK